MHIPLKKAQAYQSQPIETHTSHRCGSTTQPTLQRVANSPEAPARELQTLATRSARTAQAVRLQEMADNYTGKRPEQYGTGGSSVRSFHGKRQWNLGDSKEPLVRPLAPRVVQRYVYIGPEGGRAYRKVTPTDHEEINGWLSDNVVHRHFLNEQEMEAFQAKKTDHIGVIDQVSPPVWARLNPKKLTVAGEDHTAPVRAMHLVKAMNIKKFKDERFHVTSKDFYDKFGDYAPYVFRKNVLFNQEYDFPIEKHDHELEDPASSTLYMLSLMYEALSNGSWRRLKSNHYLQHVLVEGLVDALFIAEDLSKNPKYRNPPSTISKEGQAVADKFAESRVIYEFVIKNIQLGFKNLTKEIGEDRLKGLVKALMRYFLSKYSTYRRATPSDKMLWLEGDMRSFQKILDEERESHFMMGILKGLENGFRLVGMGDEHRTDMRDFLDGNSDKIDHFYINNWLKIAKAKNKKIANTAYIRKPDIDHRLVNLLEQLEKTDAGARTVRENRSNNSPSDLIHFHRARISLSQVFEEFKKMKKTELREISPIFVENYRQIEFRLPDIITWFNGNAALIEEIPDRIKDSIKFILSIPQKIAVPNP